MDIEILKTETIERMNRKKDALIDAAYEFGAEKLAGLVIGIATLNRNGKVDITTGIMGNASLIASAARQLEKSDDIRIAKEESDRLKESIAAIVK